MIKHKIFKFFLLGLSLFFLLLGFLIFRFSFKPTDITFITQFIDVQKLSEALPIKNIGRPKLQLKLFKNTVLLSLNNIEDFKINTKELDIDIAVSSAKNIDIGLKASSLFRRKSIIKYIDLKEAKITITTDITNTPIYKADNRSFLNKVPESLNYLTINNSEINVITKLQKKILNIKGFDGSISNKNRILKFSKITAKKIKFIDEDKNYSISLDYPEVFFKNNRITGTLKKFSLLFSSNNKFDNLKIIDLNNKELKFLDSSFEYNFNKNFNFNTRLSYFQSKVPIEINGSLTKDNLINARVKLVYDNIRILKILKQSNYISKNIKINNLDKIAISGTTILEVFKNKILSSNHDILSVDNKKNNFFIEYNDIKLPSDQISFKGNIIEDALKIEDLLLIENKEKIQINGNLDNIYNSITANINININKFSATQAERLLKYNLNNNIKEIKEGYAKNINIKLNYLNNKYKISNLSADLLNFKLLLHNNALIAFSNSKISLEKDNTFLFKIPKIIASSNSTSIALVNNKIKYSMKETENDKDSLVYKGKFNDNYANISKFLFSIDISKKIYNFLPKNIEGFIDIELVLNCIDIEKNIFEYNVVGKINNFNFGNNDNNEFPVYVENFNGDILFQEGNLEIIGDAKINQSTSTIKVKLNKEYKLLVDISSQALFSSFDFLEEYNFLKEGITNLSIKIIKENIFNSRWKALFDGDVYNNKIEINELLYNKKTGDRGKFYGEYIFDNLELIDIKDLTLITDDILVRGDIGIDEYGYVNKIEINEFLRGLDNFAAKIEFKENKKFKLNINGQSINMNNYFSEESNNKSSGTINISVKNFYFNEYNFGDLRLSSEVFNSEIKNLSGGIYNKNNKYSNFKFENHNDKTFSKLILTFDDFGLFLSTLGVSKKFISGSGDIIIKVDNISKQILSGKYLISNFSIKDASFLARLLQLASFTGLLEILASEGIPFTNLEGSFVKTKSKVLIENTRFEGLSLGATIKGNVDLDTKNIKLKGVLIPAYAINSIINKIPLLGQIITGVEGEGIIGFDYKAEGSYENPEYFLNPFSVLTPGIIRSIFKGLSEDNNLEEETTK